MLMEPLFELDAEAPAIERHSSRKSHGVHYTPLALAQFVARRALSQLDVSRSSADWTVLDPACGDGELLLAVAAEAEAIGRSAPHLVGVDRDAEAVSLAKRRLNSAVAASVVLERTDFLAMRMQQAECLPSSYDVVISNPPYVRTQVLGAQRAQALARQFGLTGRVDLYHAFVAAMTARLSTNGILGLLCSNRFLTTKGGQSLRSLLLRNYHVVELWDLGDSKMFEAAVLPAVVVGRRATAPSFDSGMFVSVYEDQGESDEAMEVDSVLQALEGGAEGAVAVASRRFVIERGLLLDPTEAKPWRLTSSSGSRWLTAVEKRAAGRLGDLGPVRVGIKTTADSVFIRPTWADLPAEIRPEEELLHPLLTHRVAARWHSTAGPKDERFVLYPHETRNGRRFAVDLSRFPRAAQYLERHRERLAGRDYVLKAGREWYEIWVPQQPDAWAAPKLVWPDISDRPRFFIDDTGAIVNGDCYWLTCGERTEEEMALALAVANSSFAVRYYDLCCGNRLYAGRRRFITQYLEELPLPQTTPSELREVTAMVRELREVSEPAGERSHIEETLDEIVFELFGVSGAP